MKKHIPLILSIYVAFVFLQSLFFKFTELFGPPADITVYIFDTIGTWIVDGLGMPTLGELFGSYGAIVIGLAELIASILILRAGTRGLGALLGLGVMSGAIFFHVFTPLGLFPFTDLACVVAEAPYPIGFENGCPKEYPLFFMAVGVWLSCAYLIVTHKKQLLGLIGK